MFNKLKEAIALAEAKEFEENALDFLLEDFSCDSDIFDFMVANNDITLNEEGEVSGEDIKKRKIYEAIKMEKMFKARIPKDLQRFIVPFERTTPRNAVTIFKFNFKGQDYTKYDHQLSYLIDAIGREAKANITADMDGTYASIRISSIPYHLLKEETIEFDDIENEIDDDVEIEKLLESLFDNLI